MVFLPILLALTAYVGWGVSDSVAIKVFRKNSPETITFLSGLSRIIIWLLFLPFFIKDAKNITLVPLLFNLLAGLGSGLGYYYFGKAAKLINPALVTAFSGGWGGSALIISLIFFKELISGSQWLGIGLIFIGLILSSINFRWFRGIKLTNKGFLYTIITLLLWGICGAFLKAPAVAYGWYWTSLIMLIPYFLIIFLMVKNTIKPVKIKISLFGLFLVMVILTTIADFGYSGSFQLGGSVAIVGTIAGSYATLSTILSYFIYKEPLTKKQTLGIIISLIGIVLVAYFSSI